MTEQILNTYTLSLSPDYVLSWGLWEAVRELIQNSIDQSTLDKQCEQIFQYNAVTEALTIGTTNCRLHPRSLLLGTSSKRDDDATMNYPTTKNGWVS